LPKKSEIRPEKFMPSSRNISFKKNVWQQAGGYPENMDFGEDMRFNFNVISSGYSIRFNPDAEVYWNLRDNLGAIFRQFFRYAKGDAIGRIYAYRHLIRILTLLAFAGIIIVSIVFSPWFLILLAVLSVFYCYRPYLRINYVLENKKSCIFIKNKRDLFSARSKIILLIPFLLIFIDIAKLSGYIFGFLTRRAYK
jgi:cellulose synthase/poly-beta-1,6-N-acetylglucosamine synthase-like glycosyltransferase